MNTCLHIDETGFLLSNEITYTFPTYIYTERDRQNYVLWFMLKYY